MGLTWYQFPCCIHWHTIALSNLPAETFLFCSGVKQEVGECRWFFQCTVNSWFLLASEGNSDSVVNLLIENSSAFVLLWEMRPCRLPLLGVMLTHTHTHTQLCVGLSALSILLQRCLINLPRAALSMYSLCPFWDVSTWQKSLLICALFSLIGSQGDVLPIGIWRKRQTFGSNAEKCQNAVLAKSNGWNGA